MADPSSFSQSGLGALFLGTKGQNLIYRLLLSALSSSGPRIVAGVHRNLCEA